MSTFTPGSPDKVSAAAARYEALRKHNQQLLAEAAKLNQSIHHIDDEEEERQIEEATNHQDETQHTPTHTSPSLSPVSTASSDFPHHRTPSIVPALSLSIALNQPEEPQLPVETIISPLPVTLSPIHETDHLTRYGRNSRLKAHQQEQLKLEQQREEEILQQQVAQEAEEEERQRREEIQEIERELREIQHQHQQQIQIRIQQEQKFLEDTTFHPQSSPILDRHSSPLDQPAIRNSSVTPEPAVNGRHYSRSRPRSISIDNSPSPYQQRPRSSSCCLLIDVLESVVE